MQIQGSVNILAQQQRVWTYLVNPQSLSECTPGLESWHALQTPYTYKIVLVYRLSEKRYVRVPVLITWDQVMPPTHLDLNLAATFSNQVVSASGQMSLNSSGQQQTALDFLLILDTPNRIFLQMMGNVVPGIVEQFFQCLKARLETAV